MLLWGCIPLALLYFTPCVCSSQLAWSSQPTPLSTTLVDVLSADPDYTSLLRLLQRARLIPTLNKLNGSTFFAPTNDAIQRHSQWRAIVEDDQFFLTDNIQEKLRQELFYHLLNYTISSLPDSEDQIPQVLKTLHYPRTPIEPPSQDPPPFPPWMPIPGGTLGGEPQRLRVASHDGGVWVGVDAFGEGGAQIIKERVEASNGVLLGVDDVLQVPPDLGETKSIVN
jgi:solute carrier family 25 carnitine/acylcarnitine transporter 20/29